MAQYKITPPPEYTSNLRTLRKLVPVRMMQESLCQALKEVLEGAVAAAAVD